MSLCHNPPLLILLDPIHPRVWRCRKSRDPSRDLHSSCQDSASIWSRSIGDGAYQAANLPVILVWHFFIFYFCSMFHHSCSYLGFFIVVRLFLVTCRGVQRRDRNTLGLLQVFPLCLFKIELLLLFRAALTVVFISRYPFVCLACASNTSS